MNNIKILVVEPGKKPYAKEIDSSLKSLQHEVGGYIEGIYPFEEPVAIVCNEEAKMEGLPLNRALRDDEGEIYDIVAGTFLVVGLTDDSFGSLSDDLIQKFSNHFNPPETFINIGGKIVVAPVCPEQKQQDERSLTIYQLKNDSETLVKMRFMNFDHFRSHDVSINVSKYNKVYTGPMKPKEALEDIYVRFNLNHPADFRGHSLSVSDVVVIHENGTDTAYFVDSWGFKEIPDFFHQDDTRVTRDTEGFAIAGHVGTWHAIDEREVDGHVFYLMEHDTYGDEAACIIVDENGRPSLSNIYDGFDNYAMDLLAQEVMPVDQMPDDSISVDDMKNYGYYWGGMLPMREEAAAEVMKTCTVYRLYEDDTEGMVMDVTELKEHAADGGIFGVEKVEFINRRKN